MGGVNMEKMLKQLYYNYLLSANDVIEMLDDLRNDGIIEKQFDIECIMDNLTDLFNDNIENMANEIISIYEKTKK